MAALTARKADAILENMRAAASPTRRPAVRTRAFRSAVSFACAASAMLVAVPATAGISEPMAIRATKADEQVPASSRGYLAWAEFHRFWWVEVERPDGVVVRVNPPGTMAWPGGFDGKRLVFQQAKVPGRSCCESDLFLDNVKTGRGRGFPASGNTPSWEWGPSISGDLVLFGRNLVARHWRILVFDRRTSELRTLAGPTNSAQLWVGQLSGRYAVWTRVTGNGWDVIRYDLATATRTRIPRPEGVFAQYAASVTSDGTVYFASSGRACGKDVSINVRPVGGPTTVLFSLPARDDVWSTYVDETGPDSQVLFDPGTCTRDQPLTPYRFLRGQDIWGFTDLGDGSGEVGMAPVIRRTAMTHTGNHVGMSRAGVFDN